MPQRHGNRPSPSRWMEAQINPKQAREPLQMQVASCAGAAETHRAGLCRSGHLVGAHPAWVLAPTPLLASWPYSARFRSPAG